MMENRIDIICNILRYTILISQIDRSPHWKCNKFQYLYTFKVAFESIYSHVNFLSCFINPAGEFRASGISP